MSIEVDFNKEVNNKELMKIITSKKNLLDESSFRTLIKVKGSKIKKKDLQRLESDFEINVFRKFGISLYLLP